MALEKSAGVLPAGLSRKLKIAQRQHLPEGPSYDTVLLSKAIVIGEGRLGMPL